MKCTSTLDQVVAYLQQHPWLTEKEASKNAMRYNFMCQAGCDVDGAGHEVFTGDHPESVIAEAASGNRIAHEALCAVADDIANRGEALPATLQRYVIDAARSPVKWRAGRHPVANLHRDDAIFHAVQLAISAGVKATRNDDHEDDHESACSLVATALAMCNIRMSEKTVVGVWTKRRNIRVCAGFSVLI